MKTSWDLWKTHLERSKSRLLFQSSCETSQDVLQIPLKIHHLSDERHPSQNLNFYPPKSFHHSYRVCIREIIYRVVQQKCDSCIFPSNCTTTLAWSLPFSMYVEEVASKFVQKLQAWLSWFVWSVDVWSKQGKFKLGTQQHATAHWGWENLICRLLWRQKFRRLSQGVQSYLVWYSWEATAIGSVSKTICGWSTLERTALATSNRILFNTFMWAIIVTKAKLYKYHQQWEI